LEKEISTGQLVTHQCKNNNYYSSSTQKQQPSQTLTRESSSSSLENEISQLRAELRVFFEHVSSSLDTIQRLQQQKGVEEMK
jgi:hypothetical protein